MTLRSRPAGPSAGVPPLLVLHVLLGLLAVLGVDALGQPTSTLWDRLPGGSAVAEVRAEGLRVQEPRAQEQRRPSDVSEAPTLAVAPPTQPVQPAIAADESVLDSLSATIGASPATSTSAVAARPGAPVVSADAVWEGTADQSGYVRRAPNRSGQPVRQLAAGEPVVVVGWVSGEEVEPSNTTWAELSDGTYVFSTLLRRVPLTSPPALPPDAPESGRWIDVNLREQVAVAYEGQTPARLALISTGRPGWDTPIGRFAIGRRLVKDTMDGATLVGQGPDGKGATYKVEDVKYVQYFTADGAAIHENTWRQPGTFGMPGSHGCIGMTPADAAFFWDFAALGTPVVIHE